MRILEVDNLQVSYGLIQAVQGVSMHVDAGEIVSLVGSNGAGKSSALLAIAGLIKSTGGRAFKGSSIAGRPAHRLVSDGLIMVPEGRGTIGPLTVQENLEMGAYTRRDDWRADLQAVYDRFPILKARSQQQAQTLSGGEQQMLAIARAMLAKPELILLDEPSMGLAPLMVTEVFKVIEQLNKDGVTILLVEQNAQAALGISHRAYVMERGRIAAEGSARELAQDAGIVRAYLA